MNYIEQFPLKYSTISADKSLYDTKEIELHDMLPAKYLNWKQYPGNPDICALPFPLKGDALTERNTRFPVFDPIKVKRLRIWEKENALLQLKDLRFGFDFHEDVEQGISDMLISTYSQRKLADMKSLDSDQEVWSYKRYNFTSNVLGMCIVGTSGSGKTVSLQLSLSKYPHAIKHSLPGGYTYTQIPVLSASAFDSSAFEALYNKFALQIDSYLCTNGFYHSQMLKQHGLAKKQNFLESLIIKFHVGLIVIDEVQLINWSGTRSLDSLLALTAETGVSICIAGTEEVLTKINQKGRHARRFRLVISDSYFTDKLLLNNLIKVIWTYQWIPSPKANPSPEIVDALVEESAGCIDLLVNIYIYCQYSILENRAKEITPELIHKLGETVFFETKMLMKQSSPNKELELYSERKDPINSIIDSVHRKQNSLASNHSVQASIAAELLYNPVSLSANIMKEIGSYFKISQRQIDNIIAELEDSYKGFKALSDHEKSLLIASRLKEQGDLDKLKKIKVEQHDSKLSTNP